MSLRRSSLVLLLAVASVVSGWLQAPNAAASTSAPSVACAASGTSKLGVEELDLGEWEPEVERTPGGPAVGMEHFDREPDLAPPAEVGGRRYLARPPPAEVALYCYDTPAEVLRLAADHGRVLRAIPGFRLDRVAPRRAASHACSFSGATVVLMANGTTKPIADIELGDMVLAEDPETGERGAREVTKLWIHQDQLTDLELEDGSRASTTEDHPFWNHTDSEWQRADALDPGELLLSADGDLLAVDGMDAGTTRTTSAYNLTVDDIHTYFVRIGTEDILVHNNNTCGLGLGVADPPARIEGPWTDADLHRGLYGHSPRSLGSPELHHAGQMPGAGIHEVLPTQHRLPGVHPNRFNQGVTDAMRTADRRLHWWYRAQEMGAWDRLGTRRIYDNWPGGG